MNIYYCSLYYINCFSSGANKRFDELGKRLLIEHRSNFKCIVTVDNKPAWCPIEQCVFIPSYSSKLQRIISWLYLSIKMLTLPAGIFINDFMPIPLFSGRHKHMQTIYDLRNFEGYGRGGLGAVTGYFQKRQLSSANKIITISDFTSEAIQKFCSVDQENIIVSYCGLCEQRVDVSQHIRDIDILYVATFEKRKNHKRLMEAIKLFDYSLNVTFVGSDNGLKQEMVDLASSLQSRGHSIRFLEQVSENELREVYCRSKVFCFPSLYEGFGMPLVEAYQFGCNVVCSDIAIFREVTMNKGSYFDPCSEQDIKDKLRIALEMNVLEDSSLREEIVKRYSWDSIFRSFKAQILD